MVTTNDPDSPAAPSPPSLQSLAPRLRYRATRAYYKLRRSLGGPDFVDVVYVVDINGKSLAVVARHLPGSSAQDLAELQAIVDSIQIDP